MKTESRKIKQQRDRAAANFSFCFLISALCFFVFPGCTTRFKAEARAREAYLAGQRQAFAQIAETNRVNIRVIGPVRQPEILWEEGLTLAQAVAAAGYTDIRDPRSLGIIRRGARIPFDPADLLRGKDIALEPGDTIEIHP